MSENQSARDGAVQDLLDALLSVDQSAVRKVFADMVRDENRALDVERLVVPALEQIGSGWETGQYSLSQVYLSSRMCAEMVDEFLPVSKPVKVRHPVMAVAVLEDSHLLGNRIVYSVLRASGFELLNFGRQDVDSLVDLVRRKKVKILLISVLMLPSALKIRGLREAMEQNGLVVRLVVGGAPFRFDSNLWKEVGADACGYSASEAVGILHRLIAEGVG